MFGEASDSNRINFKLNRTNQQNRPRCFPNKKLITFSVLLSPNQKMSSNQIYMGLGSERSSSRVQKSPGGGHTDIFGAYEAAPIQPKKNHQESSLQNFFKMEDNKEKKINETSSTTTTETIDDKIKETTIPGTPQRNRVPPGGHSTRLW